MSSLSQTPIIGIDVSACWLDIYDLSKRRSQRLENNHKGHQQLIKLAQEAQAEVCFEATGGHEWRLWSQLVERDIPARQLPPAQIKAFARSQGKRAKTDQIDAQLIAEFAAFRPACGRTLPAQNQRHIRALVTKRQQLVAIRKQILLQQKAQIVCGNADHFEQIDKDMLDMISGKITSLESTMETLINQDQTLARKDQILRSIPGVGPVTSSMIIAELPEMGHIKAEAAAALVGVAPFAQDSGKSVGKRTISGGRKRLRNVIFQAALVARNCNPSLKAFAHRLKNKGKTHKVIIIAVARKLISIMSSLCKNDTLWADL